MFKLIRFCIYALLLTLTQTALAEQHNLLLDGVDGKKHALNEYVGHGQWVVVNVWATACPYCRHELFDLSSFYDVHHMRDATVLGLTLDWPSFELPDKSYVAKFAADYLLDYPLLMVSGDIASQVLGRPVNMVPMSFIYNPQGQLVYQLNGMVTQQKLEKVIQSKPSNYHLEWAEQVPPVYQPK
jgi:peroxiredoxin